MGKFATALDVARRVAQAFDFSGTTKKTGAPSFALFFAKGGNPTGDTSGFKPHAREAKSHPRPRPPQPTAVTRTRDRVQMMSPVETGQTGPHDKPIISAVVVPAFANSARTGHPNFRSGKVKPEERVGHLPSKLRRYALGGRSRAECWYFCPSRAAGKIECSGCLQRHPCM